MTRLVRAFDSRRMPLRDRIAFGVAGRVINSLATPEARARIASALRTGDPEAHEERADVFGTTPLARTADAVAAVVVNVFGLVVLVRKDDVEGHPFSGMWHLPGGKVEPGETDAEALRRELAEETGLRKTVVGGSLGEAVDANGTLVRWYHVSADGQEAVAGDDVAEVRFAVHNHVTEIVPAKARELWPEGVRAYFASPPVIDVTAKVVEPRTKMRCRWFGHRYSVYTYDELRPYPRGRWHDADRCLRCGKLRSRMEPDS